MKRLNRTLLSEIGTSAVAPAAAAAGEPPEKVLQFGEGGFLRAFADYMFDVLNEKGLFHGGITVVQPIPGGMVKELAAQDGLYTLIARGLQDGAETVQNRIITSITKCVNPYDDFDEYIKIADNPELRYVISNTTEAGIAYDPDDAPGGRPQNSFPGKVTAFLHRRYERFGGDPSKGLVFLPCELIDNNGDELKRIVTRYAREWELGVEFTEWLGTANVFANTLVDRITPGYPRARGEDDALCGELGYRDDLLDTCELFHFWAIEGKALERELPFAEAGLNVVFTDDVSPYKRRKVRLLNGAHTCSVPAAFLCGIDTVGAMAADKDFSRYLRAALYGEIIPSFGSGRDGLEEFADSVIERFANPYIEHYLLSIALNSASKFKVRVLPSILEYRRLYGAYPKILTFSMAALIAFYKAGNRDGQPYQIADSERVFQLLRNGGTRQILGGASLWDADLTADAAFCETVDAALADIAENGMRAAVRKLLT